jgi:ParB-like chromosome segregation protein Spo0J
MRDLRTVSIDSIIPYENNPRKNDKAVGAVAESLKQCSYINPIIVDENMVILAGDTRLKALKKLGKEKVTVLVVDGLSEDQKKKYRFLDNKTGEKATWDLMKLEHELEGLDLGGFDFFGMATDLVAEEDVKTEIDYSGSTEIDPEEFDNGEFKYVCPKCGFRFN